MTDIRHGEGTPLEILKEMTALYVEDDPIAMASVGTFLERRVKTLIRASNGKEGYNLFMEHRPDLVVTDLEMPVMNGLEMIQKIREYHDVPIIITTGYDDEGHQCAQASQVLIKPILLNELCNAMIACSTPRKSAEC